MTVTTTPFERHPWNTSFEWVDRTGPFEILTTDQANDFDRNGFIVLDDVLPIDRVTRVRDEIDAFEAELDELLATVDGGRVSIAESGAITFTTHLVTRSPLLRHFAAHPVFTALCADLVGPDVNLYWDQAVYKKPEKPRRFPWHQDNGYAFVEPQQYLTCWVPLTDATLHNGCPQVATGQHRNGTIRHTYVDPLGWECFSDPANVAVAEVRAGGVVVFSSLTPHMTGPNTTDEVRKAYILQYAPEGATVLNGDPDSSGHPQRVLANDPERQFAVLRDGLPPRRSRATGRTP